MDILFSWLIKSFIVSAVLYLYYLACLRNKKFHSYNRFYLLVTVILSILAPFVQLKWPQVRIPQNTAFNFLSVAPERLQGVQFASAAQIIVSGAVIVSTGLLFMFFSKIVWVFKTRAAGKHTRMQGFNFIETAAKQAPFSFLNNLFWKEGMATNDIQGQKILTHELVHIRQGHTYDKLFCQCISCICWVNPFFWLIQKELNIIHEFLADEKSIEAGDAESFAMMLLYSHSEGRYLNPSHSFFNSSIKRRLGMIASPKNSRYSHLRRLLAIPVGLLLLSALAVGLNVQTAPKSINGAFTADEMKPIANKKGDQNDLLQKQHAEKLAAEKAARN